MCAGLGEFAETIASGFEITSEVIKCMVCTANELVLPLHNDGPQTKNLFRVSISLSECIPDFAMRYEETQNVLEMARGFFAVVAMDMHTAGRIKKTRGSRTERTGVYRARHFTYCQSRSCIFRVRRGSR
jgi:hypothetical protein